MKPLKLGISGVRGIAGETFTPELAVEFAQAFRIYFEGGKDFDLPILCVPPNAATATPIVWEEGVIWLPLPDASLVSKK